MAYLNAIYYVDLVSGSDAARASINGVNFVNNGSGVVRGYKVAHGLVTGAVIQIGTGTYSGYYLVNRIDADNFDCFTARAQGTITVTGTPIANESFVIGGQTFTFKASRTGTGEVKIGTTIYDTAKNIQFAIQTDLTAQTCQAVADVITIYNLDSGTAGNSVRFTENATGITISGSGTLSGGANLTYTADRSTNISRNGGMNWADAYLTMDAIASSSSKHQAGDIIRIAKSDAPVSTGQQASFTSVSLNGGGFTVSGLAITSSTNASPIVVTKNSHGFVDGDVILVTTHTVNTNANGLWLVTNKTANTFELYDLDGNLSVGNGTGGASGYMYKINPKVLKLQTSAISKPIVPLNYKGNWTPGTNVTSALYSVAYPGYCKSQDGAVTLITGTSGANQILAQLALPAPLNLSGYNQVCFWIKCGTSTNFAAGNFQIRLYSDTACTVLQDTLAVPGFMSYSGRWVPVVIDKGSALYNGIQGIAFYAVAANPSKTFLFDHFIACKDSTAADAITLYSIVGRSAKEREEDTHVWYPVQAIIGNYIILDSSSESGLINNGRGHWGDSGNFDLYRRETTKVSYNTGDTYCTLNPTLAGTLTAYIQWQGGYNKFTSLPVQDGDTILDCRSPNGQGVKPNSYNIFNYLSFVRFTQGYQFTSAKTNIIIDNTCLCISVFAGLTYNSSATEVWFTTIYQICNCDKGMEICTPRTSIFEIKLVCNNTNSGISDYSSPPTQSCTSIVRSVCNNGTGISVGTGNVNPAQLPRFLQIDLISFCGTGINLSGHRQRILNVGTISYCNYGVAFGSFSPDNFISGAPGTFLNNTYHINSPYQNLGICTLKDFSFSGGTLFYTYNNSYYNQGRIKIQNYDLSSSDHRIYSDNLLIRSISDGDRHTASGLAWKFIPWQNGYWPTSPLIPNWMMFGPIYVNANQLITFKCFVKKFGTTSRSWVRLMIKGGFVTGISNDVFSSYKADDSNWEELFVTATPTEAGMVEFYVVGGWTIGAPSTSDYFVIDDITLTQS